MYHREYLCFECHKIWSNEEDYPDLECPSCMSEDITVTNQVKTYD